MKDINDIIYMQRAIELAKEAEACGDVPIGAVVVNRDGTIIGEGKNTREAEASGIGHAEINAIENACKTISSWHLDGCTLYVTLEPCTMCAGACVNTRIERVVYALKDAKAGALGSVLSLNSYPLNHKIKIDHGVCESEARELLSAFFEKRRAK